MLARKLVPRPDSAPLVRFRDEEFDSWESLLISFPEESYYYDSVDLHDTADVQFKVCRVGDADPNVRTYDIFAESDVPEIDTLQFTIDEVGQSFEGVELSPAYVDDLVYLTRVSLPAGETAWFRGYVTGDGLSAEYIEFAIPEPTTLALLAAAGLAVSRRRMCR